MMELSPTTMWILGGFFTLIITLFTYLNTSLRSMGKRKASKEMVTIEIQNLKDTLDKMQEDIYYIRGKV